MPPQDFKEFLELLNANGVEYLLVGGYSVVFHGYPRYTGDMDIWVNPNKGNVQKLIKVISDFGFPAGQLKEDDFRNPDNVFQIGVPPLRIDILSAIDGCEFEACYKNRKAYTWGGVQLNLISITDLKQNKKSTGRRKDLDDLDHLP